MKKILVTGASGQLGLTLKELAPNYPNLDFEFESSENLDITDKDNIERIFVGSNYDFCINCAAYTNVEEAEKNPQKAFEVNEKGVKYLALACLQNRTVLVHISTDYVFDGEKGAPYYSNDKPNPINEYGKSKLAGEKQVQSVLKDFYIVRTSWLYSKRYGRNFYKTILSKAKKGGVLQVTDDQIGCPTDTVSLSKFLIEELVLKDKPFQIYHFTDKEAMTWFEFAKKIIEQNNFKNRIKLVADKNYRTFAPRPKNSILK